MSNKFKVGDRVRRTTCKNNGTGFTIRVGDVLTVAEVSETGWLYFDIPGVPRKSTPSDPEFFELVNEGNPFKTGDKVVALCEAPDIREGGIYTITTVDGDVVGFRDDANDPRRWHYVDFRAAIKGKDYDVAPEPVQANTGHMPDGSGIQQHSAGEHYPYVLVYRDKKQGCDGYGRYDVGVIGPQNQTPLWFKCLDHAVRVIETMKGNEA